MSEDRPEPTGNAVMDAIRIDGVSPDLTAFIAIDYVEACFDTIGNGMPAVLDPSLTPSQVLLVISHLGALGADLAERLGAAAHREIPDILNDYRLTVTAFREGQA